MAGGRGGRAATIWLAVALTLASMPGPAAALPWAASRTQPASPAFAAQWARTDGEAVRGGRSWYWGPAPWFDTAEFYRESPNGLRQVQYFDKGRMERNQPDGPVTNGLLVVELVSGQRKLGDQPTDNAFVVPSNEVVAGDPREVNPDTVTYGHFYSSATINDPTHNRAPDRRGQPVSASLGQGWQAERPDLAERYAGPTRIAVYREETGHNIPTVIWDFLHQTGPVEREGLVVAERLIDWLSAMGYPITEPYWVRTRVAGIERDVLIQLFERRVVTYTPDNPAGYQVEMGNVGQHYVRWRYPELGYPWAVAPPQALPIFFAGRVGGAAWGIYSISPATGVIGPYLPTVSAEMVPYSLHRAYGPAPWLLLDSRVGNGLDRQLYGMISVGAGQRLVRLTYSDGTPFPAVATYPGPYPRQPVDDYNPAVSPDGHKLVFVSTRSGRPQLSIMGYVAGDRPAVPSVTPLLRDACAHEAPSWSPDGRSLVWLGRCDGTVRLYQGDLAYTQETTRIGERYPVRTVEARLVAIRQLTDGADEAVMPRWSPDGTLIAFASKRGGAFAISLMAAAGGDQWRLTQPDVGEEMAPSWSPDGSALVFAANRAGRWRLETVNRDGTGQRALTGPEIEAHWPIWAQ